ncbi:hypothetical protein HY091_00780 [Candidatus Kaiserbacteria bacterium]|nr:hypothetical protein [Candidatus Kaiserbacteria bacterium]
MMPLDTVLFTFFFGLSALCLGFGMALRKRKKIDWPLAITIISAVFFALGAMALVHDPVSAQDSLAALVLDLIVFAIGVAGASVLFAVIWYCVFYVFEMLAEGYNKLQNRDSH